MSQSDKVPPTHEKKVGNQQSVVTSVTMEPCVQPALRKRKLDNGFVGVHIGAGQHSHARTATYLAICASACQEGVAVLKRGGSAVDAATAATTVLENAGETNAGYGSNLVGLPINFIADFRVCSQNWPWVVSVVCNATSVI